MISVFQDHDTGTVFVQIVAAQQMTGHPLSLYLSVKTSLVLFHLTDLPQLLRFDDTQPGLI